MAGCGQQAEDSSHGRAHPSSMGRLEYWPRGAGGPTSGLKTEPTLGVCAHGRWQECHREIDLVWKQTLNAEKQPIQALFQENLEHANTHTASGGQRCTAAPSALEAPRAGECAVGEGHRGRRRAPRGATHGRWTEARVLFILNRPFTLQIQPSLHTWGPITGQHRTHAGPHREGTGPWAPHLGPAA